ncbi:hypothetical protein QVD17_16016 [Tagetes erecta]|uniref:Uncharacterized protein n=1 Tax=Tagetes erecta TaxID=13708 RepID=A0AAD8KQY3_TARER|nr:hypothetical protein QVD17_16016 [Tagetes erecta]
MLFMINNSSCLYVVAAAAVFALRVGGVREEWLCFEATFVGGGRDEYTDADIDGLREELLCFEATFVFRRLVAAAPQQNIQSKLIHYVGTLRELLEQLAA